MKISDYINMLNDLRGYEMRMTLIYRRLAQVVDGPWRDSLAAEFVAHSEDEAKHADLAMRKIVSLGGEVGVDLPAIPAWNTLNDMLSGLCELEDEGVTKWQGLYDKLDSSDAFKHVIEDILVDELEHSEEVRRWMRGAGVKTPPIKEDLDADQGLDQGSGGQPDDLANPAPADMNTPEAPPVGAAVDDPPAEHIVVGDSRRLHAHMFDASLIDDSPIGEAWQSDDGELVGTGVFFAMLFEPTARAMYKESSIGLDVSPLTVLAMRLSRSPFIVVNWENADNE